MCPTIGHRRWRQATSARGLALRGKRKEVAKNQEGFRVCWEIVNKLGLKKSISGD